MNKISVPVFMYHSVGIVNKSWHWSELTIDYRVFERQLQFLKKRNYNTIHLNDLYDHLYHAKAIPEKSVILTFDDGYADNYIFLYPLLKKYGFKGTIFVNPEFVDPRAECRKMLFDTGFIMESDFSGFLSWAEMLEMEKDGTIDIQSHALTHTWYPVSNEIIDFRHPEDPYIWMTWNDYPDQKYRLQIDDKALVKLGTPVYKHEKSLHATRFFPDKALDDYLQEYVNKNGGYSFFKKQSWREDLFKQSALFYESGEISGHYETEEDKFVRLKQELEISKRELESKLKKDINFLCWPGGSGSEEGNRIAFELGYLMTTAARDIPARIRKKLSNNGNLFPERIARTSPILIQKKQESKVIPVYCDEVGMWLRIKAFNYNGIFKKLLKLLIIGYGKFMR